MNKRLNKIEVCFSTDSFEHFKSSNSNIVVVDILRATSAICTAFMNNVRRIIPVGTLEEAKALHRKGFVVAAERDGVVQEFADFGNSPFNFTKEKIEGKEIVYSTTNGTRAIQLASNGINALIGSFLNITALANLLIEKQQDVLVLCAGWKNKFSLEDTVFAGALSEKLINSSKFDTICDSTIASLDLWSIAKNDVVAYIDKAANRQRLKRLNLDDVIEYCHTPDITDIIPILKEDYLITYKKIKYEKA